MVKGEVPYFCKKSHCHSTGGTRPFGFIGAWALKDRMPACGVGWEASLVSFCKGLLLCDLTNRGNRAAWFGVLGRPLRTYEKTDADTVESSLLGQAGGGASARNETLAPKSALGGFAFLFYLRFESASSSPKAVFTNSAVAMVPRRSHLPCTNCKT